MTTHSPEPWSIRTPTSLQPRIVAATGQPICDPLANEDGMEDVDQERIVAAVNACQGIETEHLSAGCVVRFVNQALAADRALQKLLIQTKGLSPASAAMHASELAHKEMPK